MLYELPCSTQSSSFARDTVIGTRTMELPVIRYASFSLFLLGALQGYSSTLFFFFSILPQPLALLGLSWK